MNENDGSADQRFASEIAALNDDDLGLVSGGADGGTDPIIYNNKGQRIGYRLEDGTFLFFPCPDCAKPMHMGWGGWNCDPCDQKFAFPKSDIWFYEEHQLVSAGS